MKIENWLVRNYPATLINTNDFEWTPAEVVHIVYVAKKDGTINFSLDEIRNNIGDFRFEIVNQIERHAQYSVVNSMYKVDNTHECLLFVSNEQYVSGLESMSQSGMRASQAFKMEVIRLILEQNTSDLIALSSTLNNLPYLDELIVIMQREKTASKILAKVSERYDFLGRVLPLEATRYTVIDRR